MRQQQLKANRIKKKRNIIVEKSFRQIQISEKVFYQNMKTYKGNRKDTNLLNINFKTIIIRILQEMCRTKEVSPEQISLIQKYKQSPPSFESLIMLIYQKVEPYQGLNMNQDRIDRNKMSIKKKSPKRKSEQKSPNVLRRLRQLFESSEIIKMVLKRQGNIVNKLLMIKYVEGIRLSVIGKGQIIRWKDIKQVTVLKEQQKSNIK